MSPVRKRLLASLVIAAALVVAAVATLGAMNKLPGLGGGTPPVASTTDPGPRMDGHGPTPPKGVWMGAWVKPTGAETQQNLVTTYRAYERTLGRRMDLAHLYHPWEKPFPKAAELTFLHHGYQVLVSWGGTDTRSIAAGQYDDLIRQRARAIKRLHRPILLMWRGEMDRPNLQAEIWSPADYITAWRHIRTIFAQVGATNVGWVWCPTAQGFTAGRAQAYYPGDNQVDWLCVDAYPDQADDPSFADVTAAFRTWAKGHDKPIVIGEYGADRRDPQAQTAWLRGAWQTMRATPSIKAATYFDEDNVAHNGNPYKYALRGNTAGMRAFGRVLADPHFNTRHLPVQRK
ncbi:MAG TPA: glycosyl hydrolase [Streptosporangiaceae bacterium]|jgi:hypothetical protein